MGRGLVLQHAYDLWMWQGPPLAARSGSEARVCRRWILQRPYDLRVRVPSGESSRPEGPLSRVWAAEEARPRDGEVPEPARPRDAFAALRLRLLYPRSEARRDGKGGGRQGEQDGLGGDCPTCG